MRQQYRQLLDEARKNRQSIRRKTERLRKMRKGSIDAKVHVLHDEAFEKIDCLGCANCCKTTGPLFTGNDITRLARHLNLNESDFIEKYLRIDEDNDYVLKTVPCPFLDAENYCTVYEARPKACREYPHTDRVNQAGILKLTEKNSQICPAVADIFKNLEL